MNRTARILVTNDDGVGSPGLAILENIARAISDDVWVVAPASNQSGVGHKFTLATELCLEQHDTNRFSLNGTPADCVVAGMTHLLREKPADLVLSGINCGRNTADIIHCSGTAAGAREGVLQGAVGIALSQSMASANEQAVDWQVAETYGVATVQTILANHSDGNDVYYNVNFPCCCKDEVSGIEAMHHQRFSRSAFQHYPSENEGYFFVTILKTPQPLDEKADHVRLQDHNAITVTPLALQTSDMNVIENMRGKLKLV